MRSIGDRARASRRVAHLTRPVLLAAVVFSALTACHSKGSDGPSGEDAATASGSAPITKTADAPVLRWLSPLAPNVRVYDHPILLLSNVDQGSIWIVFGDGAKAIWVQITASAPSNPSPPASTKTASIYFMPSDAADGQKLVDKVAEAIGKNAQEGIPPGLLPFDSKRAMPPPPLGASGVPLNLPPPPTGVAPPPPSSSK